MQKVITIAHKGEPDTAIEYWKSKSHDERIEALEFLRKQYMLTIHADERLQRVFTIVERQPC